MASTLWSNFLWSCNLKPEIYRFHKVFFCLNCYKGNLHIVNAYCQFSQQECTNVMQTYLYSLISTHFFILTTSLHCSIVVTSRTENQKSKCNFKNILAPLCQIQFKKLTLLVLHFISNWQWKRREVKIPGGQLKKIGGAAHSIHHVSFLELSLMFLQTKIWIL